VEIEIHADRWRVINDTVMGGVSRSEILPARQGLLFRGQLSTENNGGFASIRCRFEHDFAGIEVFRLVVCGDGRRYQFRLRSNDLPDGIAWRSSFGTDGMVQVIDLPVAAFDPVIRGRLIADAAPLDTANVRWLGFMLADRKPGSFELKVHTITGLTGHKLPR